MATKIEAETSDGIIRKISKNEFLEIIKEEDLLDYVHLKVNTYDCQGEYYALINQVEAYFTLLITGERGKIIVNSVFATMEELYDALVAHMSSVKLELGKYGYKPFDGNGINEDKVNELSQTENGTALA